MADSAKFEVIAGSWSNDGSSDYFIVPPVKDFDDIKLTVHHGLHNPPTGNMERINDTFDLIPFYDDVNLYIRSGWLKRLIERETGSQALDEKHPFRQIAQALVGKSLTSPPSPGNPLCGLAKDYATLTSFLRGRSQWYKYFRPSVGEQLLAAVWQAMPRSIFENIVGWLKPMLENMHGGDIARYQEFFANTRQDLHSPINKPEQITLWAALDQLERMNPTLAQGQPQFSNYNSVLYPGGAAEAVALIAHLIPAKLDDTLIYSYGIIDNTDEVSRCKILCLDDGMRLHINTTIYYDQHYVHTGTVDWDITRREVDGKLIFNTFLGMEKPISLAPMVLGLQPTNHPGAMLDDNTPLHDKCNLLFLGSDLDLLTKSPSAQDYLARYATLVIPNAMNPNTKKLIKGELLMNCGIIYTDSEADLFRVLHGKPTENPSATFYSFLNRDTVIPQIPVMLNGKREYVAINTSLADVLGPQPAASILANLKLLRRFGDTNIEVNFPAFTSQTLAIPLVTGDELQW